MAMIISDDVSNKSRFNHAVDIFIFLFYRCTLFIASWSIYKTLKHELSNQYAQHESINRKMNNQNR